MSVDGNHSSYEFNIFFNDTCTSAVRSRIGYRRNSSLQTTLLVVVVITSTHNPRPWSQDRLSHCICTRDTPTSRAMIRATVRAYEGYQVPEGIH